MTGYEEALTDPSYAGQILTFTYPMIGNYGISGSASQYRRACVAGTVIKQIAYHPSHHLCTETLPAWLDREGIPTLIGADTRAITMTLREHGTIWAALAVGEAALAQAETSLRDFVRGASTSELVQSVATRESFVVGNADGKRIVVIDCGVKRAILRELEALGARVAVLPYDATEEEILRSDPDAIFISPGPGDPTDLSQTIDVLRGLVGRKPLYGICLGHQLLALACGARTYKLPYGHRGGNQPVKDLVAGEVLVTAHNHGYAVDAALAPGRARSDDDESQRRNERRIPPPTASGCGRAVSSRGLARSTRCPQALRAMVRRAAAALALLVLFAAASAGAPAQALQRLTVTSFVLSTDTASPAIDVPFHLVLRLRVRQHVARIENLDLPMLAQLELLGDMRETVSNAGGTEYRETITVVAHASGAVAVAPATLQAVDARDGRAKEWYTNGLTLRVGANGARVAGTALRALLGLLLLVLGLALAVAIVAALARRPRVAAAPPRAVAPPPPPPPEAVRSPADVARDALAVLRVERTRVGGGRGSRRHLESIRCGRG